MIAWRSAGWVLCAASLALGACAGPARIATRLPPGAVVLDSFGDGQALATGSTFYVLDGADAVVRNYIKVLSGDRRAGEETLSLLRDGTWGGRGAGAGSLFSPRGLDVSELLILVADEGRGEIVRYSRRGDQAAPLVVPDLDSVAGLRERTDPTAARGRPVAIVSRAGTVWVADAGRGHVLRFADGRLEAILGGPADGDAALTRPSALALGRDGTLYVTDGQRVQTFGPLGRPGAALSLGFDAASVTVSDGRLLVAGNADGAARIAVGPVGGPLVGRALDLGEPLRGALFYGDTFIVLTPTRLIRLAR